MIRLNKISKTYDNGESFVVNEVSFTVEEGKTLVLLGSSGCGKTTTLKMINRLIEPSEGDIEIDGQSIFDIDPVLLRRSIGYAFQGVGLFPHMTIEENIAIVLRLEHKSVKQRKQRAHELLDTIKLDPSKFADRFPSELSGGQQQRVGVARALASNSKYLLMDEPFGALDALNRDAMQDELAQLRNRFQKTIVFVTHDIFEALRLGDQIAVMNKGKIEQIGSGAQLINQPKTEFVRSLFQKPREQLLQFSDLDSSQS